ncbi:type II toxin-antitoxin system RelB/DinJ family antitoxin [Testudinibacter aquarius]|uniref:RHH-type rel operon transcriptional repressor/antitoxin RelB n=1 Tax=Testudinibacter aquarius TaxID=1524974 RepID=A0A4R3Y0C6_9PAST|nr:type II toxin-antitoxin system RelB/DinJ family antitoxin [Testudinibacter aquarius]KAE9527813.1 bifunctional antitoxin/transcriptional repressor RelB [Testudinibacter aquarius]TCV84862.1 RHH-type rel operon transcriptional repressor/antitoxin RelB [Testudinibacter aquarius]TNG92771.1 type II toxin-antitoxin system RelB/DinJ family antitoxin [Testudinibacter aquarius]
MATLNIRLDDQLKQDAYHALQKMNMTPTEAVRILFQYVAQNKKFPIQTVMLNDEDLALLETVRYRLNNPEQGIKVTLDEL